MPTSVNSIPLIRAKARRIVADDVSVRTRLVEIATGLDDVIAMGRGDPDFNTPRHIVAAAQRALDENQHHYTHPAGMPALREAIAEKLSRENGLDYSGNEVIVTSGVQEAVLLCMLSILDPADEVLIASPRFTSYDAAVAMAGGTVVSIPTREEDDFATVPGDLESRITGRTKMIVLITPNNPTGAVTPPAMVREIAEIAIRHDLIVLSDEIYEKLVYDDNVHLSIASLPGMRDRTITLNGFSKAYAMTGWRVGYLAAPEPFARMLVEPRHTLSIATNTPAQFGALAALTGPQDAVHEMVRLYGIRRRVLMGALDDMGLRYGHPGGAFYIYVNTTTTGMESEAFCETILRECRVLFLPGTLFGDTEGHHIRIGYLQPIERIQEAIERIRPYVTSLVGG